MSWVQVAGSALAAVSSAVLLSTLGVAGTVIGAALGSVIATVGSALYTRTLNASRQQVAAQTAALRRVTHARSELDEAEQALAVSGTTAQPRQSLTDRMARRGLSWKRLAAVAAGVFLAAMVAITAFELVTGEAVSQLTGGSDTPKRSTVPGLGRDLGRGTPTPSDGSSPSSPSTPSADPTSSPSTQPTPSTAPTTSPTPTPTVIPTPSPSPGLTGTPTELPPSTASAPAGG